MVSPYRRVSKCEPEDPGYGVRRLRSGGFDHADGLPWAATDGSPDQWHLSFRGIVIACGDIVVIVEFEHLRRDFHAQCVRFTHVRVYAEMLVC